MSEHLIAWLRLSRLPGVGPVLIKRLLEALGSPEGILEAHPAGLASVEGIGTFRANQIMAGRGASEKWAREELQRAQEHGVTVVAGDDPRYPPALKTIPDPPVVLYVRGELVERDAVAVGIVGARQCTLYGREQAGRFGHDLAAAGLTVISGGARGIDTGAHLGALKARGRTVVVQGCGLLHTYPPENKELYERIVREGAGAVISELPLDAPPTKENFPPRNRIIAGMSLGVLVVEANLRSGSLITARLAAADYGREVFALPGRVDSAASAGTHHLIKTGSAHLVESVADILEHLGDVGEALKEERAAREEAPAAERSPFEAAAPVEAEALAEKKGVAVANTAVQTQILEAIPAAGATIDELLEQTGLGAPVLMAELTMLQIGGALKREAGNRFVKI
ncbi:MAG: DNA-processing protein DprA [Phycisphaerae bacterium]